MSTILDLVLYFFFFQAEDGIRDFCLSRGLGDVYKRQIQALLPVPGWRVRAVQSTNTAPHADRRPDPYLFGMIRIAGDREHRRGNAFRVLAEVCWIPLRRAVEPPQRIDVRVVRFPDRAEIDRSQRPALRGRLAGGGRRLEIHSDVGPDGGVADWPVGGGRVLLRLDAFLDDRIRLPCSRARGGIRPRSARVSLQDPLAQNPRDVWTLPATDSDLFPEVILRQIAGGGRRAVRERDPCRAEVLRVPDARGGHDNLPYVGRVGGRDAAPVCDRSRHGVERRFFSRWLIAGERHRECPVGRVPVPVEVLSDVATGQNRIERDTAAVAVALVKPDAGRSAADDAVVLKTGDDVALAGWVVGDVVRLDYRQPVVHRDESNLLRRLVRAEHATVARRPESTAGVGVHEIMNIGMCADANHRERRRMPERENSSIEGDVANHH